MNRVFLTVLAGCLLAGVSLAQSNPLPTNGPAAQPQPATPQGSQQIPDPAAQQPQAQPTPQPPATTPQNANPAGAAANTGNRTAKIAPGSVIPVQLTKTVDAKKAKTGDQVVAKVTMDMKTNSGEMLVPKDTKVIGHVTEAQARSKEQKESQMGIAFDRAVTKDGNEMSLPMSIQAIIGQQNNNAPGANDQGAAPPTGGTPAAGSNAGRAAGMGGSAPPTSAAPSATDTTASNNSQTSNGSNPPITGNTQGVVGIPNMTLSCGPNGAQGSVITSDKNNVKLESGTMLLLKVNQ